MVDDSYTRAHFGALSSGAENFAIAQGTLRRELDELQASLESKLALWEDSAKAEYTICKQNWNTAASDMAAIIQQLGLAIGTAHDNYTAAERYGVSIWS